MPGSRIGGIKAAQTNKAKYGADFYARIGQMGGRAGTGHAFGHGLVDPSKAGKVGGTISKRGPAKPSFFVADEQIDAPIIEPFNKEPWYKGWIRRRSAVHSEED